MTTELSLLLNFINTLITTNTFCMLHVHVGVLTLLRLYQDVFVFTQNITLLYSVVCISIILF